MAAQDVISSNPLPPKVDVEHIDDMATRVDHEMTPWQCIRKNPKAIIWTVYANRAVNGSHMFWVFVGY